MSKDRKIIRPDPIPHHPSQYRTTPAQVAEALAKAERRRAQVKKGIGPVQLTDAKSKSLRAARERRFRDAGGMGLA
ncbi:hypothetical protein GTQ99_00645 [Kineococcus sp. T13]|uniref:hypothetical protein n=1 Tax=Kineococcus vitellinus TaxID=2696565 RepID=UPI001412446F|nr:hypothetical protein [Kineococcus vitellinus]NAZ73940.1 hypothetical protein [Kineococcus vitellinus]